MFYNFFTIGQNITKPTQCTLLINQLSNVNKIQIIVSKFWMPGICHCDKTNKLHSFIDRLWVRLGKQLTHNSVRYDNPNTGPACTCSYIIESGLTSKGQCTSLVRTKSPCLTSCMQLSRQNVAVLSSCKNKHTIA